MGPMGPCKHSHECCEHRGARGGEQGKGFSAQGKSNMAEAKTRSSNDNLSCWLINSHHTDCCWEKSSSCAGGKDNLWGSWGQQMDRWGQGRPTRSGPRLRLMQAVDGIEAGLVVFKCWPRSSSNPFQITCQSFSFPLWPLLFISSSSFLLLCQRPFF